MCLTAVIWSVCSNASFGLELDELETEEIYFSPTRLKQSPHDIPASVSKITQDTIRDLQIRSIPELLKYVAGMVSGNASGNQPRINYHGTSGLVPRRMQVLLDGISVYRPSYAEVSWPTLPISINDIDVVEVTRSPSAATYGANSMMAVINIKTKDPYDVSKFGAIASAGGRGAQSADLFTGGKISDTFRYKVSVSSETDNGYDKNYLGEERRDGSNIKRFNGRLDFQISPDTEADFSLGYTDALTELEYRDSNQLTFPDIDTESIFTSLNFIHRFTQGHELQIKSYFTQNDQNLDWKTCYPTILFSQNIRNLQLQNPAYVQALVNRQYPTGGSISDDALRDAVLGELSALGSSAFSPTCGWINEDAKEQKSDLEIQDTIIIADNLRLVSGLGVMNQSIDSETFTDGSVSVYSYQVFGNAEYRWNRFVFNLGGMYEYEEGHLYKPELSPRLGINYRLNDTSTVRFVFSKAYRTPDILEFDRNWSYVMRGMTPPYPLDGRTTGEFYFSSEAEDILKPEEIIAREISFYTSDTYSFMGGTANHVVDVKYFHDSLSNLVSEKLQFFDYHPTNDGSVRLQGFEVDANLSLSNIVLPSVIEKVRLHANYAYTDNDTDQFYERSLQANHSGAAYVILNYHGGWLSSLAYYGNSAINGETFDGWEFGFGRAMQLSSGSLTVKGKAVYWPDKEDSFVVSDTFDVKNINDETTTFYVTLDYSLR